jgi:hypothetical protein
MPAISTLPPDAGWRFVLQMPRLEVNPSETHAISFASYSENTSSFGVQIGEEPMRHTIFVREQSTADRAKAEGWKDITEQYKQQVFDRMPKLSTAAQAAIHSVLTEDPKDKAQLVAESGIADSEWRTTIKLLEERRIAKCTLGPRQRKAASNRAYKYVRGESWAEALNIVE